MGSKNHFHPCVSAFRDSLFLCKIIPRNVIIFHESIKHTRKKITNLFHNGILREQRKLSRKWMFDKNNDNEKSYKCEFSLVHNKCMNRDRGYL